MADGVELATDVYLPTEVVGSLPTVLMRLPYDKCSRDTRVPAIAAYLAAHGFAVVAQDVRGKFRSDGRREPFVHEAADGAATLDWIVAQPWSSGAVGMYGESYYGFTQWAAASTGHPALRAIVPRVTGSTLFDEFDAMRVPKIPLYEWAAHTFTVAGLLQGQFFSAGFQRLEVAAPELAKSQPSLDVRVQEVLDALVQGVADGSLLQRSFGGTAPATHLSVPALHMSGWFNHLQRHQLDDWRAVLTSPAAHHQYLRMGARDNEDFQLHDDGTLQEEDGTPRQEHRADNELLQQHLEQTLSEPISFLRHYLTGRQGRWKAPRVRYHIISAGWQYGDQWPPRDTHEVDLHLHSLADSTGSADGGTLVERPLGVAESAVWLHDPGRPVPWLGASAWSGSAHLLDERVLHERPDVPTFTTSVRERPYDVVGTVGLDLAVSAPSSRTHVIARLLDVCASGRARLVVEGAAVVLGKDRVHIRLGDTGYRVRPGHRLRLAISTSLFPLYAVHSSGKSQSPASDVASAQPQVLTSSPAAPAVLHLPLRGW